MVEVDVIVLLDDYFENLFIAKSHIMKGSEMIYLSNFGRSATASDGKRVPMLGMLGTSTKQLDFLVLGPLLRVLMIQHPKYESGILIQVVYELCIMLPD